MADAKEIFAQLLRQAAAPKPPILTQEPGANTPWITPFKVKPKPGAPGNMPVSKEVYDPKTGVLDLTGGFRFPIPQFFGKPNGDWPQWQENLAGAENLVSSLPARALNLGLDLVGGPKGKVIAPPATGQMPEVIRPIATSIANFFGKSRNQENAERLAAAVPQVQARPLGFDPSKPQGTSRAERAYQYSGGRVSPEYFLGMLGAEGDTRNPNSSADGVGQFIDATALMVLKRYGQERGLTPEILAAIPADGRMKDGPLKARLLALKKDEDTALWMNGKLAVENQDALTRRLGKTPDNADLYLAHFAGPQAAGNMITGDQSAPAASFVRPEAARANPTLFYRQGRPATVAELRAQLRGNAATAAGSAGRTWSTTLPAPPEMQVFQAAPPPVIPAPPQRSMPIQTDFTGTEALIAGGKPTQTLTPEQIKAREKAIVMERMLTGLASGFLPGMLRGYGQGKREGLEFEQGLQQAAADAESGYSRWATDPTMRVATGKAADGNAVLDTAFQNDFDAWKTGSTNADRQWEAGNSNRERQVAGTNTNATNRWEWQSSVAKEGGLQVLGSGAVLLTQPDPQTGKVTQSIVDISEFMPGLRRQGEALGALGPADMPAETKARLGALSVAAGQGAPAVWLTLADEVVDSPRAEQIIGKDYAAWKQEAVAAARGDAKRAEGIFKAKVAAEFERLANSNPQLMQQELGNMNTLGIVTAGGILQHTRPQ